MDLFLKTRTKIYKVNKSLSVRPSYDNQFLSDTLKHYTILIDDIYEIGFFKTENDAIDEINNIYSVLEKSQFAVTNIIIYNFVKDKETYEE